jgi:hypothetical protein
MRIRAVDNYGDTALTETGGIPEDDLGDFEDFIQAMAHHYLGTGGS